MLSNCQCLYTYVSDPGGTPPNTVSPAFNAELRETKTLEEDETTECFMGTRTPVASAFGPRSSHTNTQPEVIARLSSVSNRRETMGSISRDTAWKMTWASAGDLTRRPLHVGLCIGGAWR
jgi:hypothetical protein